MHLEHSTRYRMLSVLLLLALFASSTGYTHAASASGSVPPATQPLPLPTYDPTKVANPSATVSAGSTAIGATPASFTVSPGGAATYAIPLQVVPGRAGFQPNLSIEYNSAAGNGPLGVGFSLSGVSSISRCARTLADDGEVRGVQLDSSDRFCLGNQKLVLVSGIYGADNAEYRTLPDTHVRVKSYVATGAPSTAGPTHFIVELPDGTIQYYGRDFWNTSDLVQISDGSKTVNLTWPLLTAKDGSDNGIAYAYDKTVVNGRESERWLSAIRYGHLSKLDREVRFGYEPRPDKSFGWLYGSKRESTKRLRTVSMFLGAQPVRSYSLAYINLAAGALGSRRSKLSSITECGSVASECLRPTEFGWLYGGTGFQNGVAQTMALPSSGFSTIIAADLNGDGRTDFAYPELTQWKYTLSHPAPNNGVHYVVAKDAAPNTSVSGLQVTAYPLDYDLDGKTDLIPRGPGASPWTPILSRGTNGGYIKAETNFFGPLNQTMNGAHALFGDFNGDGLQDVLEGKFYDSLGKWRWFVRLRTGTVDPSVDTSTPYDHQAFVKDGERIEISLPDPNKMVVLDINGDGRDEIVWSLFTTAATVAYDPVANVQGIYTGLPGSIFNLDIKLADLNGDGLVDLVTNGDASATAPGTTLYYWVNTGRGFASPQPMTGFTVGKQALKLAQVVDINADGRFELLLPHLSSAPAFEPVYDGLDLLQGNFTADGALVFGKSTSPAITFPSGLTKDDFQKQGLRVVDADGDGQSDLVVFDRPGHATTAAVTLYKASPNKGDRLTAIREGNQVPVTPGALPPSVKITYTALTDDSVYRDLYDPQLCPRLESMSCATGTPLYVVKQVERDSGLNGSGSIQSAAVISEYRYSGGRFDKKAPGFAGFAEIRVASYALQGSSTIGFVEKRSFYSNTVPGQLPHLEEEWTHTYLPNNREALLRTTTAWAKKIVGPTYFELVAQTQQREYEFPLLGCGQGDCLMNMSPAAFDALGHKPHKTVTASTTGIDIYGNVVSALTNYGTSVIERTEVQTSYEIDTAHWLLRRPKTVMISDRSSDGQTIRTENRTVDYVYYTGDKNRHLVKQTRSYANVPTLGVTVDYEYYPEGMLSRTTATDQTTGEQRQTAFAYDFDGFPHAVRNALGHTSYTGYDPLTGKLKIAVDANGLRTDYTYNTLGRLVKTRLPNGLEQHLAYSLQQYGAEFLLRVETSDATGAKTQLVSDRGGRPLLQRSRGFDGVMREQAHKYDALGRMTATTSPKRVNSAELAETTSYTYDNLGRPLTQTEPGNVVRSFAYDKLIVTATDTRGHKTRTTLNERGQTITATDGLGTPEETTRAYGYAPFGKLSQTEVLGVPSSKSRFFYDQEGRLSLSTDPERGQKSHEYNGFGELTRRLEGANSGSDPAQPLETSYIYDLLGRLDTKTVKQNGALRSVTDNTYDSLDGRTTLGALLRAAFTDQVAGGYTYVTNYYFDSLSRPAASEYTLRSNVKADPGETFRVTHSYDALGRPQSLTYPKLTGQSEATRVFYEYAPAATSNGRLLRVKAVEQLQGDMAVAKETVLWEAEATDQQDRLSQFQVGNGVHTQHSFDWRGLTTATTVTTDGQDDQGELSLARLSFIYDGEGNLMRRTDDLQAATETFAYDPLNRLLASSTKSADPLVQPDDRFTYDTLGNLMGSIRRGTYSFDPAKPTQVIAVTGGVPDLGKRTYGYDFLGNQVSRPEGKVVYNDFNLPARYTTHANETTASFLYDAAGQRVRKISSAGTVTYVPGLYERHRKSDGTIEHQLLVPEAGATLRYLEQNGSLGALPILYTHGDHLGSTSLLTQQDPSVTGYKAMVVEKRSYESFGRPRNPDWKSPDVFGGIQPTLLDQGYTGHIEDREHGLVNMKGRIYDPMLGRFITPDPYVDGTNMTQRWNRYAYVSNNPLSFSDPSGFRMNLEAIKQRVEANATMFSWAVGTLEGQFSTDFEKFMSGHVAAGEFQPVNPGSPLAATQLWKSAMVADWAARRADACFLGCSAEQLDKLMQDFAEDWNLPIKVKHQDVKTKNPLKEAAPSTNGSVGGNDMSGYADQALDPTTSAPAPDTSGAPMSTIIFELPGAGRDVFHIYDGTVEQRGQIMLDLALILGTPRGIEMLTKMDGYEVDIVLGDFGMAYVNDGVIAIDPDFHPITETTGGLIRASTLRVLAHELGHKIMGDLDDGLKHLNNTKRNENPIMNNLGEPARTRYECPKKGCY